MSSWKQTQRKNLLFFTGLKDRNFPNMIIKILKNKIKNAKWTVDYVMLLYDFVSDILLNRILNEY